MNINLTTGLLDDACQCPSPNADDRPDEKDISLIVVHSISLPPGEYDEDNHAGWVEKFFSNQLPADAHPYFAEICDMKVSAHTLIKRNGEVTQFVPFHRRAWHAGLSQYKGRQRCNDFSIGIELEGTDDSAFTQAQYSSLANVIDCLRHTYPAIGDNLVGHSDIAPGRKTDPGTAFDWAQLRQLIRNITDTNRA